MKWRTTRSGEKTRETKGLCMACEERLGVGKLALEPLGSEGLRSARRAESRSASQKTLPPPPVVFGGALDVQILRSFGVRVSEPGVAAPLHVPYARMQCLRDDMLARLTHGASTGNMPVETSVSFIASVPSRSRSHPVSPRACEPW